MRRLIIVVFCIATVISCQPAGDGNSNFEIDSDALFQLLPSSETGIDFINQVEDGLKFNVLTYRNFYNGGGVAIGDINNDGLTDVFFTANMKSNRLYLNKGELKFEEIGLNAGISGERGWSTGVSMVDINGDGFLDIYVCNSGDIEGDNKRNELFINNGDLTFTESAESYNLADEGYTTHASFFDYDQDGDLDCYILNNSYKDPDKVDQFISTRTDKDNMGGDKLFRNDGNKFTDVTSHAGIFNSKIGFGLGVSVSDVNNDNMPDIYISNDFYERDYLYLNNGDGTFKEELTSRIDVCSVSSMGADIGDINNDGNADIFTTDMLAGSNYRLKAFTMFDTYNVRDMKNKSSFHYQLLQNTLQLNDGDANFQELANLCNVTATDWSWGALVFDFDNDGWKDIFVANGIYKDIMYLDFTNFINDKDEVKKVVTEKGKFDWRDFASYIPSNAISNYAFKNTPRSKSSIPNLTNEAKSLGLATPSFSNGSAYGDLDNDGDLDLIVNNVNMEAFIYENTSTNNYLKVKLAGSDQNRFGIGAVVKLKSENGTQTQQLYTSRGFESSVDPNLVFGLGDLSDIESLEVVWPDGSSQIVRSPKINTTLMVDIKNANGDIIIEEGDMVPVFIKEESTFFGGNTKHTENRYNDFDHERLAIKMISTEGPVIIKGDLNGDGQEDIILGGAGGDADKVFYQKDGKLVAQKGLWAQLTESDKDLETTAGAIFDADGDGDNDVLLGAGGNEYQKGVENFVLRYYQNDGNGRFSKQKEKTPPAAGNVSCIRPSDFDNDGDMDLFIGSRVVPGNYGLPPRSFLFRNDGNNVWQDITTKQIGNAGMVTDATWSDIDGDKDQDLIIVGDWMPILILENKDGKFEFGQKQTQKPYAGWWNSIKKADLDGDGDDDFVLGNWGQNSKFKATDEQPLSMFVKDFDNNKKAEFIINWYPPEDNVSYPFAEKTDITGQLPSLKKSILSYEEYSKKTYNTLLSEEERSGAFGYKVNTLSTSIMWNNGTAGMSLAPLPIEAQVTCVYGIAIDDFDRDGIKDIWLGGNFYEMTPQAGRSDSGKGTLLRGAGNQTFEFVDNKAAGIRIEGEVRDATVISTPNGQKLIVARNNQDVVVYDY